MERPLDGLERQFWRLGRAAVFNIVVGARVQGPLTAAALERGLAEARHRHPLLGARIASGPQGPRFVPGAADIVVREEPLPPGEGWRRLAEDDLHAPFPDEGPLLRARLLRTGEERLVLLSFHHAVGDGFAAWGLLRDVLTVAGGGALPKEPLPAPAMGTLLPPSPVAQMPPPPASPAGLPAEGDAPPRQRRTRLLARHLPPDEVRALAQRAKAEGTTVQGALAAAMLRAVAEELPRGTRPVVGLNSPLSFRDRLTVPVGDAFGLYAFAPPVFLELPREAGLWPLAREVRRALQALADGGAAAVLARLEDVVPRDEAGVEDLAARVAAMPPVAAGVTNLGRVAAPPLPGDLALRSFDCAASLELAGPCVVVYAVTFDGRLDLTFMHAEPLVGAARAARVADAVAADLRAAAAP